MLEVLRRKGVNKTILWFISIIIILSFGFFGTAYLVQNNISSVGTMYGRPVSRDDFDHDEWRDLMTRCYGAIEDSKYDEIFDNIRHEAANFLMIRSFQKCAAHV